MSFLRFLMLLSLVVWLGGIIFLAFVEAPTAFSPGLLPSRHRAGSIIARPLAARHLLIALMLLLTMISQFAISPKLHALRAEVGVIDNLPPDSPQRREFDRLHIWSEKFEEAVLLLGLVATYSTAQAFRQV